MSIDALTLTAIIVMVVIVAVMIRICTLAENACSGPNEYFNKPRKGNSRDGDAE